jgi:hypothetical protein
MAPTDADLKGLNFLLHGATILDLAFDPERHSAILTIAPTTSSKTGLRPVNALLDLSAVSAVAVTLQDQEGRRPRHGMTPIGLEELGQLVQHTRHPLAGVDFIDSERNSTPKGMKVFEWFDPDLPGSKHTLSFFFGLRNQHDESALLVFLILFDDATLKYPNGEDLPMAHFAPAGVGYKAVALEGASQDLGPITVLPDPVSPASLDGQLVGLVFVNSDSEAIVSFAVGKASWDGEQLRWCAPDQVTYDIPEELTHQIRPRLPNMSRGAFRLDGFSYWATIPVRPSESLNARELVRVHLKRTRSFRSAWRFLQR